MKSLIILGSTGSIGTQALEVARRDGYNVTALAAGSNIKILEEHDNVAMACQLICDCGCNHFIIFHTGKVTKGILAPYLIKKDKQIVIKAVCKDCGKSINIFDSKILK